MNQYPIWIGLVIALVMTWASPNPLWWMIAAVGAGANGVVCAANEWRMPVWGINIETCRHTPMMASTRYKWLGDIIPTGFGKASVGDFLLAAGVMGFYATRESFDVAKLTAVLCLFWWGSGWARGFALFSKWPAEARRDSRKNLPIVLFLMVLGNLLHVRGYEIGALRASASRAVDTLAPEKKVQTPTPEPPRRRWRDLGKLVAPPAQLLTRLQQEAAQDEMKRRKQVAQTVADALSPFTSYNRPVTAKSKRQGPFCRVTCAAHHGGEYDVETRPEFCSANWLPKTAWSPGWIQVTSTEEEESMWPGPATAGFDHYKLYWSPLQSEARTIHKGDPLR